MQYADLFIEVVRACEDLPMDVRTRAKEAYGVEETYFDKSYIEFLDTQIRLSPRGPEWTEILQRRRDGLCHFCGVKLLSGHVCVGRFETWIKIDPKLKSIVFWELRDYEAGIEKDAAP